MKTNRVTAVRYVTTYYFQHQRRQDLAHRHPIKIGRCYVPIVSTIAQLESTFFDELVEFTEAFSGNYQVHLFPLIFAKRSHLVLLQKNGGRYFRLTRGLSAL